MYDLTRRKNLLQMMISGEGKQAPKPCSPPLQHREQWPADGRLAQKSSCAGALWGPSPSQFISTGQVTTFDTFLSKALKTKQSISCSPTDAKTAKLNAFTLGRKTIYYSKSHSVRVSSMWPLLLRSTCTLCSQGSPLRHPFWSRIIPIPAQNSLRCKFGSLISCLKCHQILANDADFFHEINHIFPRLVPSAVMQKYSRKRWHFLPTTHYK